MRRKSGFTLIEILLAIAIIAMLIMGYMIWGLNQRMGEVDAKIATINSKGQRLTEWAKASTKYTKHDNDAHDAASHSPSDPPSHIPPPPPPDPW